MEKVSHSFIKIEICIAYKTPIGNFQDRATSIINDGKTAQTRRNSF